MISSLFCINWKIKAGNKNDFKKMIQYHYLSLFLIGIILFGCTSKAKVGQSLFEVLDHTQTNLHFSNKLKPTPEFNMFNYMYFYNGAGVAAGDFNNDGKTDLFFAANQGKNHIYLNEGNLHFKDITETSALPQDNGWSTGVSVVDINNDGFLDFFLARHKVERNDGADHSHNQHD